MLDEPNPQHPAVRGGAYQRRKNKRQKSIMETNKIYKGDCRTMIEELPSNVLIVSDPPYNIGFNYPEYGDVMSGEDYTAMFSLFKKFPCVWIHYPEEMIRYVCAGMGFPEEVVAWVYSSNIPKHHRMVAWFNCKPDFSKIKQPYKNLTDKRIQGRIAGGSEGTNIYDWWEINLVKNVSEEKQPYTNQIPEEVVGNIIKTTARKDSVIVDPFCGSGTTPAVAEKLGYKWIGIDFSPKAISITEQRIKNINPLFSQQ